MDAILAQKQRATSSTSSTTTPDPNLDSSASATASATIQSSFAESDVTETDVESISGSLSSIAISIDDTKDDPDFVASEETAPPKIKKQELISERVVGVLDKCGISGRCAVHLLVALLIELKLDPKHYNISLSTISNRRTACREAIFEKVKDKVEVGRGAVVHFDGKLMSAITGKAEVDRLAVKVTYKDVVSTN